MKINVMQLALSGIILQRRALQNTEFLFGFLRTLSLKAKL
jgi:hypothetical protein